MLERTRIKITMGKKRNMSLREGKKERKEEEKEWRERRQGEKYNKREEWKEE